ncbi:hypothetical protein WICMUC_004381 [Wickerhamomyces mucosus]|uniref:Uncharacterized protein n=1 Tax=Wickerhamomyces mucosus TaxID=1378264 RepID=A0A9P8TAU3_9ASCO|nr:hypothetical protein WICMUC_004381 [Wickerhamomyces mucosus]
MVVQKLLPSNSTSKDKRLRDSQKNLNSMAFEFPISSELRELLKANKDNINNLKIIVKNGSLSLKVIHSDEPKQSLIKLKAKDRLETSPKIDIFKQFTSTILKNIGTISSVLIEDSSITMPSGPKAEVKIKSPIISSIPSTPVATSRTNTPRSSSNSNGTTSTSAPPSINRPKPKPQLYKKFLKLLVLGPHTLREISSKLKISTPEVSSIIDSLGQVYKSNTLKLQYLKPVKQTSEDLYVLKFQNYQDLKIKELNLNDKELEIIVSNCKIVIDHLNLESNNPLRIQIDEIDKKIEQQHSTSLSSSKVTPSNTPITAQTPLPQSKSTSKPTQSHGIVSNYRSTNNKSSTSPVKLTNRSSNEHKRKFEGTGDDYFKDLAQRFKTKYKEYENLYKSLNHRNESNSNQKELEKLFEMHRTLENWKSQLWKSVNGTKT